MVVLIIFWEVFIGVIFENSLKTNQNYNAFLHRF